MQNRKISPITETTKRFFCGFDVVGVCEFAELHFSDLSTFSPVNRNCSFAPHAGAQIMFGTLLQPGEYIAECHAGIPNTTIPSAVGTGISQTCFQVL